MKYQISIFIIVGYHVSVANNGGKGSAMTSGENI